MRFCQIKKGLLISLASLIFFLGLLELGLRLAGYLYSHSLLFENKIKIQGNRPFVILTAGDSYTVGGEGLRRDNYPNQLQEILSKIAPQKFIVLNGGICEANSTQVFQHLSKLIKAYKVDSVILLVGAANRFNFAGYHQSKIKNTVSRLRLFKIFEIFKINLQGKMLQNQTRGQYYRKYKADYNHVDDIRKGSFCGEYENILESNPKQVEARYQLAKCYSEDPLEYKKAEVLYKEVIAADSSFSSPYAHMALVDLGEYYQDQGNYMKAAELYQGIIARDPAQLWAYGEVGKCYLSLRQYDKVEALYQQVGTLDLPQVEAYVSAWRGHYYYELGKYKESETMYRKAIELNPALDGTEIYESLSRACLKQGNFAGAFDVLLKAIEFNSRESYFYYLLVKTYMLQSRYDASFVLQTLERIREDNPGLEKDDQLEGYISFFRDRDKKERQLNDWLEMDLEKIVRLCRENNILLIIQNYPYPYHSANRILKEIALRHSLPFIDNYKVFRNLAQYDSYFVDSDHLTADGHRIMAENVYGLLSEEVLRVSNQNRGIKTPDEAVFEYRELLKKDRGHQPEMLRRILYMQAKHEDPNVRRNVAEVIGELDEPDVSFLWRMILQDEADVKLAAVEGLCHSQKEPAFSYLMRLLDSKDVLLRGKAAECIGDFGNKTILKTLEAVFKAEENEAVKIELASAMVQLGDNAGEAFIRDSLLTHKSAEIRKTAVQKILFREIPLSKDILKTVLMREDDPSIKAWVAGALAKQGDGEALSYLKTLLSGEDVSLLRSEVAQVLNEIGEFQYTYPFLLEFLKNEDDYRIRELTIEKLVDYKGFELTPLLGGILLNDESIVVREIAAWAMGERRDPKALPYLEKGLYDDSAFVRTGVVAALYKILQAQVVKSDK